MIDKPRDILKRSRGFLFRHYYNSLVRGYYKKEITRYRKQCKKKHTAPNLIEEVRGYPLIGAVRAGGLEPPRRKSLDPKSSAATNYATRAFATAKLVITIIFSKFYPLILTY